MVPRNIIRFLILALLGIVAACAPKPVPVVVAPPPPPPVIVIPTMPTPPLYAATNYITPAMGIDGRRITPNSGIDEMESVWHMRSALNVAALNCVTAEHLQLTENYNQFLDIHKKQLNDVNKAVEAKFRRETGSDYRRIRDTHSTRVYNFFSLPPVKAEFCDVALAVSQQLVLTPTDQLTTFSYGGLRLMEDVFERFFNAYDQYQRNLYAWYAEYAPDQLPRSTYVADTQPGNIFIADEPNAAPVRSADNTAPILTTNLPASDVASPPANDTFDGYTPSAMPYGDVVQPLPQPNIVPAPSGEFVQPLPGTTQPAQSSGEFVQPLPGVTAPVEPVPAPAPTPSGAVVQPLPGQTPTPPVAEPIMTEPANGDVWITANGDSVGDAPTTDETPPADPPQ